MKHKLLLLFSTAAIFVACNKDADILGSESAPIPFENKDVIATDMLLSDFKTGYPTTATEWVIKNESATAEEFYSFVAALERRANSLSATKSDDAPSAAPPLKINFKYLTSLPSSVFQSMSVEGGAVALELSLPEVRQIFARSFRNLSILKSIDIPSSTKIEESALEGCDALGKMTFAINDPIESLDNIFGEDDLSSVVELYTGVINSENIESNTLTFGDSTYQFSSIIQENPSIENLDEKATTLTLADLGSNSYPESATEWVITDTDASLITTDSFYGLKSALRRASKQESISLRFTGLTSLVKEAFKACSSARPLSITLDCCTKINDYAFAAAKNIVSVTAPMTSTIEKGAFEDCVDLTYLDVASTLAASGSSVSLIKLGATNSEFNTNGYTAFRIFGEDTDDLFARQVALRTGSFSSGLIADNTITVDSVPYTFGSITIVDNILDPESVEVEYLEDNNQPLSAFTYKSFPSGAEWIITDSDASGIIPLVSYDGLKMAISTYAAQNPNSALSLSLPNIANSIIANLFMDFQSGNPYGLSLSMNFKRVNYIQGNAFKGCTPLVKLETPSATQYWANSLMNTPNLETLRTSTASGIFLMQFGGTEPNSTEASRAAKRIFGEGVEPTDIDLFIGGVNTSGGSLTSSIDEDAKNLTVQMSSYIFKSVTITRETITEADITSLDEKNQAGTLTLADITATQFPLSDSEWKIQDVSNFNPTTAAGLKAALVNAAVISPDREVTLTFEKLTGNVVMSALANVDVDGKLKLHINLPVCPIIGNYAFQNNDALVSITMPLGKSVGFGVFFNTPNLVAIEFATEAETLPTAFGYGTYNAQVSTCGAWGESQMDAFAGVPADLEVVLTIRNGYGVLSNDNKSFTVPWIEDTYNFKNPVVVKTYIPEGIVDLDADAAALTMSQLSSTALPMTADEWIITDDLSDPTATLVSSAKFANLVAAFNTAALLESGREITVRFPNVGTAADGNKAQQGLLKEAFKDLNQNLKINFDFPLIWELKSGAFRDATALKSISMPQGRNIGKNAFIGAINLESIIFATETTYSGVQFGFMLAPGQGDASDGAFGALFDLPKLTITTKAGVGTSSNDGGSWSWSVNDRTYTLGGFVEVAAPAN